jgi:coenzyme PQQ precursor peptide PqqA
LGSLAIFAAIRRAKSPHITRLLFRAFPHTIPFGNVKRRKDMAWTTPVLVEICIGLEINGYMPADGYVPPEF